MFKNFPSNYIAQTIKGATESESDSQSDITKKLVTLSKFQQNLERHY